MKQVKIGDVVGDYRVIDIAGSGGMGAVFKIEHIITRRIEAMKLLPPGSSSDPEQVQRFEREIQVQARLHHPNIVGLYNAIRDGNSIALVMEFVEGESLQRKLEAGPLSLDTAVDYAGQILSALEYAHASGVIHRDVAPANVIVTPEGVAKLMDFGLARGDADLRLSTSGVPLGSPWYMSPEQVKAIGPIDGRTDIYAVGAVLHEMLTGAKLFEAEGAFAMMRAHVEATPLPPTSRNPLVPMALDEIVGKAVAKDPALRFQSAAEFRQALEHALPGTIPVVVQLPPVRKSRISMSMLLAASVLAAAVCAVRLFPAAGHVKAPAHKLPVVVALPPQPLPVPALPAEVTRETPAPRPLAQVEAVQPPVPVRRRAPATAQPSRPVTAAAKNSGIRVTGGVSEKAWTSPAPAPASRVSAEPAETAPPESIEIPETSAALPATPELPAAQDAAPAKQPGVGGRLVRALGKVNPFKKSAKK